MDDKHHNNDDNDRHDNDNADTHADNHNKDGVIVPVAPGSLLLAVVVDVAAPLQLLAGVLTVPSARIALLDGLGDIVAALLLGGAPVAVAELTRLGIDKSVAHNALCSLNLALESRLAPAAVRLVNLARLEAGEVPAEVKRLVLEHAEADLAHSAAGVLVGVARGVLAIEARSVVDDVLAALKALLVSGAPGAIGGGVAGVLDPVLALDIAHSGVVDALVLGPAPVALGHLVACVGIREILAHPACVLHGLARVGLVAPLAIPAQAVLSPVGGERGALCALRLIVEVEVILICGDAFHAIIRFLAFRGGAVLGAGANLAPLLDALASAFAVPAALCPVAGDLVDVRQLRGVVAARRALCRVGNGHVLGRAPDAAVGELVLSKGVAGPHNNVVDHGLEAVGGPITNKTGRESADLQLAVFVIACRVDVRGDFHGEKLVPVVCCARGPTNFVVVLVDPFF